MQSISSLITFLRKTDRTSPPTDLSPSAEKISPQTRAILRENYVIITDYLTSVEMADMFCMHFASLVSILNSICNLSRARSNRGLLDRMRLMV